MITEITENVHWIHECYDVDDSHIHTSTYLLSFDDHNMLVDTGDEHNSDVLKEQVNSMVGDADIDAIYISKSHMPHSANVSDFISEWPDAEVIFPGGIPAVHGFPDVIQWPHYGTSEMFGESFTTVQGPLLDITHTTWVYSHAHEVFFTADGFSSYHSPGTCGDVNAIPSEEQMFEFYRDILRWMQYVEPPLLVERLEELLDEYEPAYIAPGHGSPFKNERADEYLETLERVATRLSKAYPEVT